MRSRDFLRLDERVIGRLAVVYHRTREPDTIEKIVHTGIRRGNGGMYGDGLYATYDFQSQQTPYMVKQYGDHIIKLKVNLDGFLILDRDVASIVYGGPDIMRQVSANKSLNWSPGKKKLLTDRIEGLLDAATPPYTSGVAQTIMSEAHLFKGMVYTGAQDGRCIIAYDLNHVVPMAWTTCPEDRLNEPEENFQWRRADVKSAIKTASLVRSVPEIGGDLNKTIAAVVSGKIKLTPADLAMKLKPFTATMIFEAIRPFTDEKSAEWIFEVINAPWFAAKFKHLSGLMAWRQLNSIVGLMENSPTSTAISFANNIAQVILEDDFLNKIVERFKEQRFTLFEAMFERRGMRHLPYVSRVVRTIIN